MNPLTKSLLTGAMLVAALVLVATAAFGQGISIDLGKTETGRYMNLVGNTPGSDGEINSNVYIAPEYCATNKGTSMFFAIDDNFFYKLPAGQFVIVNVEYYDAPGVQIKLVYDAIGVGAKEHSQSITTTGSNKWRSMSFIIDDAYFGNGLEHGADLKLVAAAGTMSINAVKVVPFEGYYNYGTVRDSLYMTWKEYMGGDSKTEFVTYEGEECVTTQAGYPDNYLYLAVDDSFIVGGDHPYVFVSVEYYDTDPTMTMRLQYDGASKNYTSTPFVSGKGWHSFRTVTFEIADANFNNRENGGSDLRLQISKPGLAINQILIARLPKKPLPSTNNIPNFTAYKALESPLVDGSLLDWSWLKPFTIKPTFASDNSRTDEFYRTWLLNNANVPVAEVGEPGVSDPGVPGLWDTKDLAGGVSVLWDDQNLYFSVIVKDNVVSTTGSDWTNKDGFGFYIDVSHDYTTSNGVQVPIPKRDDLNLTQGEHFFFFPADQAQPGTWRHSTAQAGETMPSSVTKTVIKTDSGYVIEASVPLSLIADGLTWKPGVDGDPDNYNPLFAWLLNDNDGVSGSSGRLMFGGYNDDDEFWGTLNMNPIPLVDRGITIDLGATNYESFIKQTELTGDGLVTAVQRAGKTAAMLNNGYLYLDIQDDIVNAWKHPHAFVSVEYFDSAAAGAKFRLQYDADTAAYVSLPYVTLGGTSTWKTQTFEITNARFESRQNGRADFRVNTGSTNDVVINQIRVALADLWIDLGDTTTAFGISETNTGGDGLRTPVTVGGVNCKRNDMGYSNTARYFYFGVADSIIKAGNHKELFVTVEYYDTTSTTGISMNYDGPTTWSNAIGDAFITGSNQWKLHTFYLSDANFNNRENGGSDFRMSGNGDGTAYVNRVMVCSLDSLTLPKPTSVDSRETKPFVFALDQNYPNPFNPSTMIGYSIPSAGRVSLKIYNILGQEVANLVDMEQAAGRHSIRWDASRLSSGVYFCRLVHNSSNVLTTKLMLVK